MEQFQHALAVNRELVENLTQLTIGSINIVKPMLNNLQKKQIFDFICTNFKSLKFLAFVSYANVSDKAVKLCICAISLIMQRCSPQITLF